MLRAAYFARLATLRSPFVAGAVSIRWWILVSTDSGILSR
jgi:hypothetical protein